MTGSGRPDAIVVGAGLGGLAAAAHLRREGLSVLVLERNLHPGGTAWNFRRKGFVFPMGPFGFSSLGEVRKNIPLSGSPPLPPLSRIHYRLRAFGLSLPLSLPLAAEAGELARSFPGDEEGIRAFFAQARGAAGGTDGEAAAWLRERIADPRLRRILGSQGTGEPSSGMELATAMWRLLGEEGIWMPTGGEGAGALVRALLPLAGEVRLGQEARRIVVEKGRVAGVELAEGKTIRSPVVVSNADFPRTFLSLLGETDLPPKVRQGVGNGRLTGSCVQVSLGLDAARVDLSAFRGATRILWRGDKSEGPAAQELELAFLTGDDPGAAPPGGAGLVIRIPASYDAFAPFRTGHRRRTAEYVGLKEKIADALVAEAELALPGLAGAVRVREVSTPLTFEDQGGRTRGAVAGWSWDWKDGKPGGEPRDLVRTPVRGLFMAGHQARSSLALGGVPTALASGAAAAKAALEG